MKFLSALAGPLARLGFGQRLALAFAVVLTLTAALGGASVFNLSRVHRSSFDLSDKWLPSVGSLAAARVAILEVRELEMKHSRAADASYHAEYEDKPQGGAGQGVGQPGRPRQDCPRCRRGQAGCRLRRQVAGTPRFPAEGHQFRPAEKGDDAHDLSDGAAKMAADESITALSAFNFDGGRHSASLADSVYQLTFKATLALLALALVVGVSMSLMTTRSLRSLIGGEPLAAADGARPVARGDLSAPIAVRQGDQSSLMARLHEMQQSLAQVVSSVRQGSQRVASASGEAAREIKGLIATSVERVEQGTAQVDEAGATMSEVVDSIARVTVIMAEISTASREQSAGVAQVSQAVTQMDRTTQQNAALVEQSAAAAESLRDQAQELVQLVASFKLSDAQTRAHH